ncbi:hypothetical protein [Terribacillus halophilus]|uniref:hypothetical protein n=1 Tax=Terribacillus halophilus TaxID=361279 RepID=UPI0009843A6D|nr:hypothetical protein [Terribacillus halophilus]
MSNELKNPSPRRGEFENRVWKIINGEGHDFSYDYLNSYLYALDELYANGAINSLLYGEPRFKNTNVANLAQLIYSEGINHNELNRDHLLILNKIITQVLSISLSNEKDKTKKELETLLEFLSWINRKKES